MNTVPTAEEMFEANPILPEGVTRQACIAFMRTYAKLHVKAALEAAADTYDPRTGEERDFDDCDNIINAYPLNLIQ